jgi:hypothetical protein
VQNETSKFDMNLILKRVFIVIAYHTLASTNCGEEALTKGAPITFKITDAKTQAVLFESKNPDSAEQYNFFCNNSLNLIVEMTLPSDNGSEKSTSDCVGFLLESRKNLQPRLKKSSINV